MASSKASRNYKVKILYGTHKSTASWNITHVSSPDNVNIAFSSYSGMSHWRRNRLKAQVGNTGITRALSIAISPIQIGFFDHNKRCSLLHSTTQFKLSLVQTLAKLKSQSRITIILISIRPDRNKMQPCSSTSSGSSPIPIATDCNLKFLRDAGIKFNMQTYLAEPCMLL